MCATRRESAPGSNIMSMAIAFDPHLPAIIEVSSEDPAIPNRKLTGTIHACANKILPLLTGEEIATSACIRVQTKDLLTLGEVLRCIPEPDTNWTVYVGVKRSIFIV